MDLNVPWQNKIVLAVLLFSVGFITAIIPTLNKSVIEDNLPLLLAPFNEYSCLGNLAIGSELRVYSEGKNNSIRLANHLCNELTNSIHKVTVSWQLNSADILDSVNKGQFDLIMGRVHLLESYSTLHLQNYRAIAKYPSYSASLVAIGSTPKVTMSYLKGKRIGLIKSDKSLSGHIIPIGAMKDAGINVGELNVTYVASHNELKNMLEEGELDVIASYWSPDRFTEEQEIEKLIIDPNIEGTKWYLLSRWANSDQGCLIERALKAMASGSENAHLKKLILIENFCHD